MDNAILSIAHSFIGSALWFGVHALAVRLRRRLRR